MMGRTFKKVTLVFAAAITCLMLWEANAVRSAESRSDAVLSKWLAKPQPLSLAALTPERKDILLRVEDPAFYEHKGVDFFSPGQGMTTITQALVKFLYFDTFTPGFAKIEQSLIAHFVLDRRLNKDSQLTLFLNQAYFGDQNGREIRGFAEAAESYFAKPFAALDQDEYIGLVAMLIGPNDVNPANKQRYGERVRRYKSAHRRTLHTIGYPRCRPRRLSQRSLSNSLGQVERRTAMIKNRPELPPGGFDFPECAGLDLSPCT